MSTATDYDAPRQNPDVEDSLEELQARRAATTDPAIVDLDDNELAESYAPPGIDLFDEEEAIPVVPMQANEFRCTRCFLVQQESVRVRAGHDVCRDCT